MSAAATDESRESRTNVQQHEQHARATVVMTVHVVPCAWRRRHCAVDECSSVAPQRRAEWSVPVVASVAREESAGCGGGARIRGSVRTKGEGRRRGRVCGVRVRAGAMSAFIASTRSSPPHAGP